MCEVRRGGSNIRGSKRLVDDRLDYLPYYNRFTVVQLLSGVLLCDPMDCSMLGSFVFHCLPKLAQIHVHRVGDAIQPSHPLPPPSPFHLLPSIYPGIRAFSNGLALHVRWPQYWSLHISPSSEYSGLISFRIYWFDLLAVQGTLKCFL